MHLCIKSYVPVEKITTLIHHVWPHSLIDTGGNFGDREAEYKEFKFLPNSAIFIETHIYFDWNGSFFYSTHEYYKCALYMIKRAATMRKNWDGEDSGPEYGYLDSSAEDSEEEYEW